MNDLDRYTRQRNGQIVILVIEAIILIAVFMIVPDMKDSYEYYWDLDYRNTVKFLEAAQILGAVFIVIDIIQLVCTSAKINELQRSTYGTTYSSPNLLTCPDCGNPVSRSASACPRCGRPMDPANAMVTCSHCGGTMFPDSKTCPNCGRPVTLAQKIPALQENAGWICSACGGKNKASDQFCGMCGQRHVSPAAPGPDMSVCPHCGGPMLRGTSTCPNCGGRVIFGQEMRVLQERAGWTCPSCGATNKGSELFCRMCGEYRD